MESKVYCIIVEYNGELKVVRCGNSSISAEMIKYSKTILHEYLNNSQVDSLVKNFGSTVEGYSLSRRSNKHIITKKTERVSKGYLYNTVESNVETIATISMLMMNNCLALSDLIDKPKKDLMKDLTDELKQRLSPIE